MRPHLRAALERHGPAYLVDVPPAQARTSVSPNASVDWAREFEREAPLAIDIGHGHGESIVALARTRPEWNVIGFEVFEPGVAGTVAKLAAAGVSNVRIVQADGVGGLTTLIPPASVTHVLTYFPDPWHKARHHKRRLIGPRFCALVADRLAPGGTWRLATDWEDYAHAMREALDACPSLVNLHDGWAPRPAARPVTKFEARGIDAGRRIYDLEYARR
jgi:tRNA (guanine-N7-)-methyltransferase